MRVSLKLLAIGVVFAIGAMAPVAAVAQDKAKVFKDREALMKQQGIVDSGEALGNGIGAMSAARVKDFYEQMVKAGLYKPGEVDLAKVVTTRFVGKKVGVDLKARLGGK